LRKNYQFSVRLDKASHKALTTLMREKNVGRSQAIRIALIYTYLTHIKNVKPETEPSKAEEEIMRLIVDSF